MMDWKSDPREQAAREQYELAAAEAEVESPAAERRGVQRGDEVEINGYLFYVDRINVSSLVLRPRPVGGETSNRRLMRLVTGQPGVYLAGPDEEGV